MSDDTKPELHYVDFYKRLLAATIDVILSTLILLPFMDFHTKHPEEVRKIFSDHARGLLTDNEAAALISDYMMNQGGLTLMLSQKLVEITIAGIVIILFWVYRSATPGKMLFRMKIVDNKTGGKPSSIQLIIRYIGYFISALPLGIGFIWMTFNKQCRGWHDYMSGTAVVYNRPPKKNKRRE